MWDVLSGTRVPLAGAAGREQFDREYDALLLETAASLEAPRAAARSGLRRVA